MTVKIKLLMIEDNKDDAFLVLKELKKGGYEVESERVDINDLLTNSIKHAFSGVFQGKSIFPLKPVKKRGMN